MKSNNASQKLLFLIPHPLFFGQFHGIGGHISHVYGVLSGMRECGLDAYIVAGDSDPSLFEKGFNITTINRKTTNRLLFACNFILKTKRILKKNRFNFVYMRYVAAFAPFVPVIRHIIHPLPLILEVNSMASQRYNVYTLFDKLAIKNSDIIVAVSNLMEKHINWLGGPDVRSKVVLLINGVDAERFDCSPKYIIPKASGKQYIGYIGILKPDYGLEELVEAHMLNRQKRKDLEMVIVGEGPIKDKLRHQSRKSAGIHFCDSIPYKFVPPVMKGFDIVVSTMSPNNKCGLSIKIFEYMAAGRPIIVARTPEICQLLQEGKEALFYEPGNAVDLAMAIRTLADNEALKNHLSHHARRTAIQKHSWKARIKTLLTKIGTNNLI